MAGVCYVLSCQNIFSNRPMIIRFTKSMVDFASINVYIHSTLEEAYYGSMSSRWPRNAIGIGITNNSETKVTLEKVRRSYLNEKGYCVDRQNYT